MIAGPRLDALLDEHLFKMPIRWGPDPYATLPIPEGPRPERPYRYGRGPDRVDYNWAPIPRYSRDIAAAWRIVEEMRRVSPMDSDENYQVFARFFNSERLGGHVFMLPAAEAAHRISLAAAEALGLISHGAGL